VETVSLKKRIRQLFANWRKLFLKGFAVFLTLFLNISLFACLACECPQCDCPALTQIKDKQPPAQDDWSLAYYKAEKNRSVLVVGGECPVPTGAWVNVTKEADAIFKKGDITICFHRESGYHVAARLPCGSTAQQISQAILAARMPAVQYRYMPIQTFCPR
jgi:hypothetical protein